MNDLNERLRHEISRRTLLNGIAAVGVGTAAATLLDGCGTANRTIAIPTPSPVPSGTPLTDADILNFALNFEYLGAQYYTRAVTGQGLSASDTGSGAGAVNGGRQVSFTTPYIQQIATQFANDELSHVRAIRSTLGGAAVPQPAIDFTNAFNGLAKAAGIADTFDPFLNEDTFLLGAFIFEEVDVTAYIGAAPLLTSAANLAASASILGVEAYHGGAIRTLIYNTGNSAYITDASKVAILREQVGGGSEQQLAGNLIVPTDSNSIIQGRSTAHVLSIAYAATLPGQKSGGFFPNGVNGRINTAA